MEVGIFVGTVYGNALSIAKEAQIILIRYGHKAIIYEDPNIEDWEIYKNKYVLIITSTTGHGDLPDNILPLYLVVKEKLRYQGELRYGIIALGDSTYTNFCCGGKKFDILLKNHGAQRIGDILLIDSAEHLEPKIKSNLWVKHWAKLINESFCNKTRLY